jgi:signal transduction histidine kinase
MIIEEVFGPINEKQAKFLRIANVEIIRINKLLNHLLNTSVLEADSRKMNSTNINTKKLVLGSAEIFVSQAEKKNITLKVNAIKQGPDLFGVKEELQQIFINIIGNAIKYSPDGGTVVISYRKNPQKGFLRFQVSDTGPGIPEDELSLIFSKYYRTKKVRGHLDGVGLGLAISKKSLPATVEILRFQITRVLAVLFLLPCQRNHQHHIPSIIQKMVHPIR